MKIIIRILVFIYFINSSFAQENNEYQKIHDKSFDQKLIGSWKGSEVGQQNKGTSKYWVTSRFETGLTTLLFVSLSRGTSVGTMDPNSTKNIREINKNIELIGIVENFVTEMGGKIEVFSSPGNGTEFSLRFKLLDSVTP